MPKKTELKVRSFLIVDDGTVIPFETITQEQRNEYIPRIMANVGRTVSDYFNSHADEARDYLERKRKARENLTKAVADLDKHLNST
ncbi:MAG: hypothetical protein K2J08_12665 [Ruminococcus sp.]|nr:hypothetical protein [Ruminococcus sp.]